MNPREYCIRLRKEIKLATKIVLFVVETVSTSQKNEYFVNSKDKNKIQ